MSFLSKADRVSPIAFRLIAAHHGVAIGPDEIAKRSGLSRSTVQRISARNTWAGVDIDTVDAFIMGCGYSSDNYKEPLRRLRIIQKRGLRGLKHFNIKNTAPLWRRGANGNRLKFIKRIITQP